MHRWAPIAVSLAGLAGACGGDTSPATAARVTLAVRDGAGGPASVTWAAFQDGDGPWRRLDAGLPGLYTFDAPSGRYSLAFACQPQKIGEVIHATVAGAPRLEVPCFEDTATPPPGHRFTGAVKGLPAGAMPGISFGSQGQSYRAKVSADGRYEVTVPSGTYDVAAADTSGNMPRLITVQRGIAITGPGSQDIDFGNGALPFTQRRVAPNDLAATETLSALTIFQTRAGATLSFASGSSTIAVLESRELRQGEQQRLLTSAFSPSGSERGANRPLLSSEPTPLPIALPPAFSPEVSGAVPAGNILRPKLTFTPWAQAVFYQLDISPGALTATSALSWLVNVEAAWLGSRTSFELVDLTTLPGYDAGFGPDPKLPAVVAATAVSSSLPFGTTLNGDATATFDAVYSYAKKVATVAATR